MGKPSMRIAAAVIGAVAIVGATAGPSSAFHLYRSTDGGCAPADGALTDDAGESGPAGASVVVGHNTFAEGISGLAAPIPVETRIKAGESITWTWNSAHCHSVTSTTEGVFDSGFLYPEQTPESQQVVPGFFDYPILDETPTLSFTHTFDAPGTYEYFCVHHAVIGMTGVVIVEPAAETQMQTAPWLALPTLRAYFASTPSV